MFVMDIVIFKNVWILCGNGYGVGMVIWFMGYGYDGCEINVGGILVD